MRSEFNQLTGPNGETPIARLIRAIETMGIFNDQAIDTAIELLTRLPQWPEGRVLDIYQFHNGRWTLFRYAPNQHVQTINLTEAEAEQERANNPNNVALYYNGEDHYDAYVNGQRTGIRPLGNCFFLAVLAALGPDGRRQLLGINEYIRSNNQEFGISLSNFDDDPLNEPASKRIRASIDLEETAIIEQEEAMVQMFRNLIGNYFRNNPQELEGFLVDNDNVDNNNLQTFPWHLLPDEIKLTIIAESITSPKDFLPISLVSQEFKSLSDDPSLWRQFLQPMQPGQAVEGNTPRETFWQYPFRRQWQYLNIDERGRAYLKNLRSNIQRFLPPNQMNIYGWNYRDNQPQYADGFLEAVHRGIIPLSILRNPNINDAVKRALVQSSPQFIKLFNDRILSSETLMSWINDPEVNQDRLRAIFNSPNIGELIANSNFTIEEIVGWLKDPAIRMDILQMILNGANVGRLIKSGVISKDNIENWLSDPTVRENIFRVITGPIRDNINENRYSNNIRLPIVQLIEEGVIDAGIISHWLRDNSVIEDVLTYIFTASNIVHLFKAGIIKLASQ